MSHVPPLILAVLPIAPTTSAADLAEMDKKLLDILLGGETKLCIVSIGSDGSSVERQARRLLVQSGYAQAVNHVIPIESSDSGSADDMVDTYTITFIKVHGRVIAIIQDPKHYRKTARNNLFSGAHVIVLGDHVCYYDLVRVLAEELASPLYQRDVIKLDRQDDLAAARLFSASFLQFSIDKGKGNRALPIYSFVLGNLRTKMVLRAKVFKDTWKKFLRESGYPENHYFISAAADDIMDILVNGYLSLLCIYRDHLDRVYPLLPWLHGSEANEHVFGMMRSTVPDFTMLHVLQMVPKIAIRLLVACRAKNKIDYRRTASGYCHTYFDADKIPLQELAQFPSDDDISQIYAVSRYDQSGLAMPQSLLRDNILQAAERGSEDDDDQVVTEDVSDRQELQRALESASSVESMLDRETALRLNEYTYAAASLSVTEQTEIENLPDQDAQTQMILVSRVIHALLSMDNLSTEESLKLNDELMDIRNKLTTDAEFKNEELDASGDKRSLDALSLSGPETISSLSDLVTLRLRTQTKEEAESVRIGIDSCNADPASALPSKDSDRKQLVKKIYAIAKKYSAGQGTSTGANRSRRWVPGRDGKAEGKSSQKSGKGTVRMKLVDESMTGASNAPTVNPSKDSTERTIMKRRKEVLADLKSSKYPLDSAHISSFNKLSSNTFGFAVVDGQLVLVDGKSGFHAWKESAKSIVSLSYLVVRCYQHARNRQFRLMKCPRTRTTQYSHLQSPAFLCTVPRSAVHQLSEGNLLEISAGNFADIFQSLLSEKLAVIAAVTTLLRPVVARRGNATL
ncbi:hypothetical protein BC834DRAFT_847449 [Gloeopeniophorella convolvens]|nr:hypothetical protein BC834DRAFT_847449 [Gloeopeniophorella convolvens]